MFFGVFDLVYGENNRPEIRKKLKTEAECKN
jgi:hypothetical protein